MPDAASRSFRVLPVALCVAVALWEIAGWTGLLPAFAPGAGHALYASVEMLLLLALLWNSWRIRAWVHGQPAAPDSTARDAATLAFLSLLLCVGGDLVNRNYGGGYFAYDRVIEHSYLADSVWFFLPGYLLWVSAASCATRHRVPGWLRLATVLAAAGAGWLTFTQLVLPGTAYYVRVLTGAYTLVITLMVPAAAWVLLAFGRQAWPVAAGAVLATMADALIGRYWLFGHGHFPAIAHLNFIVYFLSQALIQRLPLRVHAALAASRAPAA